MVDFESVDLWLGLGFCIPYKLQVMTFSWSVDHTLSSKASTLSLDYGSHHSPGTLEVQSSTKYFKFFSYFICQLYLYRARKDQLCTWKNTFEVRKVSSIDYIIQINN